MFESPQKLQWNEQYQVFVDLVFFRIHCKTVNWCLFGVYSHENALEDTIIYYKKVTYGGHNYEVALGKHDIIDHPLVCKIYKELKSSRLPAKVCLNALANGLEGEGLHPIRDNIVIHNWSYNVRDYKDKC